MHLLLVEDNLRFAALVRDGLSKAGFVVDWCKSITEAKNAAQTYQFDLVVLDLGLPDGDGLGLIASLRTDGRELPILIMTARGALDDRIAGLDSGADDYLIKPFHLAELAARCRALLRRPVSVLNTVLHAGNVALNTTDRTILVSDARVGAAPREVSLLEVLMRRLGRVVAKQSIEGAIYAMGDMITSNAMEASISRLRKILNSSNADVEIRTAHGVGYSLHVR